MALLRKHECMKTKAAFPFSPDRNRSLTWLLGTAAGAAATAQAAVVQIDLTGNKASYSNSTFFDNTDADITGDGVDDLSPFNFGAIPIRGGGLQGEINGYAVAAFRGLSNFEVQLGVLTSQGQGPLSRTRIFQVAFRDPRINGGETTGGFLEVLARNISTEEHEIALLRLIFDDEKTKMSDISVKEQFPAWVPPAATTTGKKPAVKTNNKAKLKRKIAALEARIRLLKKSIRPSSPRFPFARNREINRQIAILERQLAALKRALRRR